MTSTKKQIFDPSLIHHICKKKKKFYCLKTMESTDRWQISRPLDFLPYRRHKWMVPSDHFSVNLQSLNDGHLQHA